MVAASDQTDRRAGGCLNGRLSSGTNVMLPVIKPGDNILASAQQQPYLFT